MDKVDDTIKWLDANPLADKEVFEDKRKELEDIYNKIIVSIDRKRQYKEYVERMAFNESEKYSDKDERQLERITAKNNLESYAFNIMSKVEEVMAKVDETIAWLDVNQLAEREEFEDKQKQLEDIFNPIFTKL